MNELSCLLFIFFPPEESTHQEAIHDLLTQVDAARAEARHLQDRYNGLRTTQTKAPPGSNSSDELPDGEDVRSISSFPKFSEMVMRVLKIIQNEINASDGTASGDQESNVSTAVLASSVYSDTEKAKE